MKKQKLRAEQKEFEDVKIKMAYDKGKMESMRRQVCVYHFAVSCLTFILFYFIICALPCCTLVQVWYDVM